MTGHRLFCGRALGVGAVLAFGPWGGLFGFTTTSMALMATIVVITAAYLAAAEAAKQVALQSPLNHRA